MESEILSFTQCIKWVTKWPIKIYCFVWKGTILKANVLSSLLGFFLLVHLKKKNNNYHSINLIFYSLVGGLFSLTLPVGWYSLLFAISCWCVVMFCLRRWRDFCSVFCPKLSVLSKFALFLYKSSRKSRAKVVKFFLLNLQRIFRVFH